MADGLDNILGQIEALGGQSPKAMNAQMQSLLGEQKKQTDETVSKIRSGEQKRDALLATPIAKPSMPTLRDIPAAPVQQFRNPAQVFGNAGTVLAVMASLFTRHPMVTALNAGAAAMNAFHQGDTERLKLEHKNWESALQTALDQNQMEMDKYKTAIEDRNMSVADRMAEIEGVAAANKDEQMIAALRAGNMSAAFDLIKARQASAEQLYGILQQSRQMGMEAERLKMEQDRVAEQHRHNLAVEGGTGAVLDEDTVNMVAQQYIKTGSMPPLGYGPAGAAARRQVLKKAGEMVAQTGGDVATNKAEFGSEAASLKQLQNYVNRVDASQNVFLKNLNQVDKYSEAGIAGETPIFNKWIQAGRRATGDADVAAFDAAIKTAAREYARIMSGPTSNAQLTVSAQANADEMLSSAMNADQLQAVITVMKQDVENSKQAAQEQLQQIRDSIGGIGQGGPTNFTVPDGAPDAAGQPDGAALQMDGKVIAKAKDGKWVAP